MSEKGENCLLQLTNPQDDIRKYLKYPRHCWFTKQPECKSDKVYKKFTVITFFFKTQQDKNDKKCFMDREP